MTTHRKYNWPQIFVDFDQSNLTQTEFCQQQNLNAKYFNLKLSKRKAASDSGFSKVSVQPVNTQPDGLAIEVGNCKILCPTSMPVSSLVMLVRSLA